MTRALIALLIGLALSSCSDAVAPDLGLGPGIGLLLTADFDAYPRDAVDLRAATVDGNVLRLTVSYGGGCEEHLFLFLVSTSWMESDPVQAAAVLSHESHGDTCEAYLTDELEIDLVPLRDAWRGAYRQQRGAIVLHIGGGGGTVEYSF